MSLIFCQIQIFLIIYKHILDIFKALVLSKRQYFCLSMLIVGVPLSTIDMTLSSFDFCAHHVEYLFPPRQSVKRKIHFHNKSRGVRKGRVMHICRLHNKMKWGHSRRQRGKHVEKFDGWACYPLSLPILQDTPHEGNAIDKIINMHDPS